MAKLKANKNSPPIVLRDFSKGRYTPSRYNTWLTPLNSVRNSMNVNFDQIVGSAVVRQGSATYLQVARASSLSQSNKTGGGTPFSLYSPNLVGQTFSTVASGVKVYSITVSLKDNSATLLSGNVTLGIYATSGGLPTGSALVTSVVDASILTTGFQYVPFYLGYNGFLMTASTLYAFVLSYGGSSSNYVVVDGTAGASPTGQEVQNSGSGWSTGPTASLNFAIYQISGSYSQQPLGILDVSTENQSGIITAFPDTTLSNDVIYFNTVPTNVDYWSVSAKVRYAVMNGSVFIVNGVNQMRDCPSTSTNFQAFGTTNSITTNSVIPSLIAVSSGYMLASGYSVYNSRIYVSSLVSPFNSPFITWSTDPATGDWIDVNPDDGGFITALLVCGSFTLVFKNNSLYRMDAAQQTVDPEPVANIGCTSQEACVLCQGLCYFYTGKEIRTTDGTIPVQISRFGVQDILDGIQNASLVTLGTDGLNVYVFCGTSTYTSPDGNQVTLNNCTLKYSTLDQSWSVHSYNLPTSIFTWYNYGVPPYFQSTDGTVKTLNTGIGDDGVPTPYSLETQEQEIGDRSNLCTITDQIVGFSGYTPGGTLYVRNEERESKWTEAINRMENPVNISRSITVRGYAFRFKWSGVAAASLPIFEGISCPSVNDDGVTE